VVGTDGSDTSLNAVSRAAALARDEAARLVIVCAYYRSDDRATARDQDVLGADAYQIVGSAPAEDSLQTAADRARAAGADTISTRAVEAKPADALRQVVAAEQADLLVVGNVGLNTLAGRILGSVPLDVARHAGTDVLIVHTS
jgi:nucleotide-binding universal stress UspA family protein